MNRVRYETTLTRALLGAAVAIACGTILLIVLTQPLGLDLQRGEDPTPTLAQQLVWYACLSWIFAVALAFGLPLWMLLRRFGLDRGWTAPLVGFAAPSVLEFAIARSTVEPFDYLSWEGLGQEATLPAVGALCWFVGWAIAYKKVRVPAAD
jgi:hypothetical protein